MEPLPERIEIGDDVLFQALDQDIILLNMATSQYYGLDSIGADIWKLLMEHRNADRVVDLVCAKYEVDEATARRDLQALIQSLREAGLLTIASKQA